MANNNSSRDSDGAASELVFVYGSLRRGMANHRQLAGATWLGDGEVQGLTLYDLGPFPMAVNQGDPQARLQGELYAVSTAALEPLDRFEGVPRLYQRQRWLLSDGRAAWVYVGQARQVRHVPMLPAGLWHPRSPKPGALSLGLTGLILLSSAIDLRSECRAWRQSHGREQVAIANQIGRAAMLTKNHRLAEETPHDTASLYRVTDIQRLCRQF